MVNQLLSFNVVYISENSSSDFPRRTLRVYAKSIEDAPMLARLVVQTQTGSECEIVAVMKESLYGLNHSADYKQLIFSTTGG